MREDKRIINDYEIIQSFYVGKREVVVAENQLFYVTGGNGAKPNSIGTKVYGYSFSNKKHCFIRRCDIVGIADFEKLPEWAKKDLADIKKQINRERKEVR